MIGIGWGAYGAVKTIAHAEAEVVEGKIMAVRNADFQHFNGRFDRLEVLIKEKR
jgi:hypothetical protein